MNAVPPGRTRRSAVGAWVWVPTDEAGAAVAEIAHRLLLARRLGVHVDDDGVGALPQRTGGQLAIDRGEGIVERVHEDAAHGIDDEDARAVPGLEQRRAAARRAGGIVERPNEARRALDEHQRLLLVPGMIAERDRVGAGVDQFAVDRLGDAEAAGGVLAVDHDEIELPVADEAGQALGDDGPPAAADDVADEQNAHTQLPRKSITSRSVSTRSSRASRGVAGTAATSWAAKARPTAITGFARAQLRDREIVIAGAIADAVAGAVEGEKRHQKNIGLDLRRLGLRLADAPDAGRSSGSPKRQAAHDQRLAAAGDHRQRQPRARPASLRISGSGLISLLSGMKPETIVPGAIASGNFRAAIASAAALRASGGNASRRAMASRRSSLLSD